MGYNINLALAVIMKKDILLSYISILYIKLGQTHGYYHIEPSVT